jgi:hypothetical protein
MNSSRASVLAAALLAGSTSVSLAGGLEFSTLLSEAGLRYSGKKAFVTDKNYRRGDWKGTHPAFWTLSASDGSARLRLELTRNVTPKQAAKTMAERFYRVEALYAGGAAYPGMVTTEFEVPKELRPVETKAGPQGNKALELGATANLTYGAGAEDLISYRSVMGYLYCGSSSLLAQVELFLPKAGFSREAALAEFSSLSCPEAKK